MYWLLSIFAIALFVMNKVCVRCSKDVWAVIKQAKSPIAMSAKYSSDRSSGVIVIQCERAWVAARRSAASAFANCANATLAFKHRVVFSRFYAEFLSAMAIRCKPRGLFAVGFPPSFLLVFAARTTEALKAIHLFLAGSEFSHRLHGLACAAPLHTKRDFGPARGQAVMPMQVSERLTFHPATVLAVPCRRQCGPTTSALANAFRSFHVHISCR